MNTAMTLGVPEKQRISREFCGFHVGDVSSRGLLGCDVV
jgi:hypothetical protein